MLDIYLYKVNRNLNRCYRLVNFFNINKIFCKECSMELKGNLFKAKNTVRLLNINKLPDDEESIYFETDGKISIYDINLKSYKKFIFGGESKDLPKCKNSKRVIIPNNGQISGLTVESALAIALFKKQLDDRGEQL